MSSSGQINSHEFAVEEAAVYLAEKILLVGWEGLRNDGSCRSNGAQPFGIHGHANARQQDYRDAAAEIIRIYVSRINEDAMSKLLKTPLKPLI